MKSERSENESSDSKARESNEPGAAKTPSDAAGTAVSGITAPGPAASFRRPLHVAVGIFAIGILTGVVLWSAAHYFPSEPHIATPPETPSQLTTATHENQMEAEFVEQVPFGETAVLDSLTRGDVYNLEASPTLRESFESLSAEEQDERRGSEYWDYEMPAFAVTVESAHLVTEGAFREWYPAWDDASTTRPTYHEDDLRFIVVDVRIKNMSDETIGIGGPIQPVLRSPLFHGKTSLISTGMDVDWDAIAAIYPLYYSETYEKLVRRESDEYYNPDAKLTLSADVETARVMPNETRTLTYPFVVYRNSFSDPDAIDNLSISDFALAYIDYNPWSIVEFELA